MANKYYVSSDNINGKERTYINRLAKFLKARGHKVKIGNVSPNDAQRFGGTKASKGYIGVQIVGGNGGGTPSDMMLGIKQGYYHYDYFISIGSYEFTHNKYLKSSAMDSKWNRSYETDIHSMDKYYVGLTPNQWNKKYSKYAKIIYNDSFDEAMKLMVNGESSNTTNTQNTGSSYLDAIKDLIKVWDGDVCCKIDNGKVYINKITEPDPKTFAKEGVNIVSGSVSLSDYNPNTINKLTTNYSGKKIVISDDYLINRFGEVSSDVDAVELVTSYTVNDSDDSESNGQVSKSAKISEKPIISRKEALSFAKREWNKVKRANGHSIELKVLGYNDFKVGEWIEVYIPSFNEVCIMVINKVSHTLSASDEWTTNLSLADYYPSLSKDDRQVTTEEDEGATSE